MAINRTPVLKRCRQLGLDPVVLGYSSSKTSKREPKRRRKESEYGMQLREKQKVKFIYGVLEKQFHGYFEKAKAMPGIEKVHRPSASSRGDNSSSRKKSNSESNSSAKSGFSCNIFK